MLQIKNLNITLYEENRTILKDFSFSLNNKDKVGLIGEEGNGKSLLLKAILDIDQVNDFCKIDGEISCQDEIIAYLPQIVDQEVLNLSTRDYILKEISYNFDYNDYYKYLRYFNIDDYFNNNNIKIKNLSGGEKIKFILLIQMLKNPTILLLDEPSNDLDLDSVLWLENFIKEICIPVIFVSHDQRFLSNVSNRIIHFELTHRRKVPRHTVYSGNYQSYLKYRDSFIENEIKRAENDKKVFKEKVDRYHRIYNSVNSALRETKNSGVGKNLKDKMHTVKSMGKRLEKEKENLRKAPDMEDSIGIGFDEKIRVPSGKTILDLNLPVLKVGEKTIAKDLRLKIVGPEKICIIGPNGSGKTTFIKVIVDQLLDLNLRVGYMPQNYFDLKDYDVSAIEYLSKTFTKDEHTKISTYLGSLNFTREDMYTKIEFLSGGQKAKLYFAKMNLDKAQVLVLDEPTRNLSPTSQDEVINALKKYKGPIISASHDRNFIETIGEKIYKLDNFELKRIK